MTIGEGKTAICFVIVHEVAFARVPCNRVTFRKYRTAWESQYLASLFTVCSLIVVCTSVMTVYCCMSR